MKNLTGRAETGQGLPLDVPATLVKNSKIISNNEKSEWRSGSGERTASERLCRLASKEDEDFRSRKPQSSYKKT